MKMDLAVLYDVAAERYGLEAKQRREDAEFKRAQMKIASTDGDFILLNEAIILDKAADYLQALADHLNESAAIYRS